MVLNSPFTKTLYILTSPHCCFGTVSQSNLRCCLLGCSPQIKQLTTPKLYISFSRQDVEPDRGEHTNPNSVKWRRLEFRESIPNKKAMEKGSSYKDSTLSCVLGAGQWKT